MPYYTQKQIEQARSIDLLTYLQTYDPTELVHVRGNTYCTREHDSLKISNGKWMWWSRGFGGNSALDYLIKVKGMQFTDAMKILSSEKDNTHRSSTERSEKLDRDVKRTLLLPERNENEMTIIWYLVGRGIDYDIIKYNEKRRVYTRRTYALVAQWIECLTPNEKAAGSIPAGRTTTLKASTRWNYSILTSAFFILPQFLPQFTPIVF